MPAARLIVLMIACAGIVGLGFVVLNRPPANWLPDVALDHTRPRPQGGWYRFAVEEPATLNPFTGSTSVLRRSILPYTHDALLDRDPVTAELRPALAVSLPDVVVAADGRTTYAFELRDGIAFSDGQPVTLADVEFTLRAATSPGVPLGEIALAVRDVEDFVRTGERSFRLELPRFWFAGLGEIGTHLRVVQKRWFEARIAAVARARGLAPPAVGTEQFGACLAEVDVPGPGTGPYRMDEGAWRHGRSLTLVQNQRCWRRRVQPDCWNLAGLQLLFDPMLARQITSVLDETIDYYSGIEDFEAVLDEHPSLRTRYALYEYDHLLATLMPIVWSCGRAPFDRPEVRRALSMLFDRQAIVDRIFHGHAHVARSWFPPGSEHTAPDTDAARFDPAAARELLASAGVEGLEVEVLCPVEVDLFRRVLELAHTAFADAGLSLRIVSEPWSILQQRLTSGEFTGGAVLFQSHTAMPDPMTAFHSSAAAQHGGYANPELDLLLEQARSEPDRATRIERFREIDRILAREQPMTLIVFPSVRLLLHRRFEGVQLGKLGLFPERWWVEGR